MRGCEERSPDACARCKDVCAERFGPKSKWNGCFSCIDRNPINGMADVNYRKRCRGCGDPLPMMRIGAGVLTPTNWRWDEGDKQVDEVRTLIFQFHSSPHSQKARYLRPLKEALERLSRTHQHLFE